MGDVRTKLYLMLETIPELLGDEREYSNARMIVHENELFTPANKSSVGDCGDIFIPPRQVYGAPQPLECGIVLIEDEHVQF